MKHSRPLNPENHLSTPGPYRPPTGLLRLLRVRDEELDLHYVGEGRWALGAVRQNAVRRGIAGKMKRREERRGVPDRGKYRMAILHYGGFGHLGFYDWHELWSIPGDFSRMDFAYRHGRDDLHGVREASAEGAASLHSRSSDDWLDEIEQRHTEMAPYIFDDRKHFPQAGPR